MASTLDCRKQQADQDRYYRDRANRFDQRKSCHATECFLHFAAVFIYDVIHFSTPLLLMIAAEPF
jgi:hypothetical protein